MRVFAIHPVFVAIQHLKCRMARGLVRAGEQGVWRQLVAGLPHAHPIGLRFQEGTIGRRQMLLNGRLNPGDVGAVQERRMCRLAGHDSELPVRIELVAQRLEVVGQAGLAPHRDDHREVEGRAVRQGFHALRDPQRIAFQVGVAQLPEVVEILRGRLRRLALLERPGQEHDLQRLEVFKFLVAHILEHDLLGFHRAAAGRPGQILQAGRRRASALHHAIAGFAQHFFHLRAGKPADVGDVRQALGGIGKTTTCQFVEQPQVARVGQADQDLGIFAEQRANAQQGIPGVIQMLQHVGQDHGVDGTWRDALGGEVDVLQLPADHLIDPPDSARSRRAVEFDAGDMGIGPGRLEQFSGGAGGAADIQHPTRWPLQQGKQFLARVVVVGPFQRGVFRLRELLPDIAAWRTRRWRLEAARHLGHEFRHPRSGGTVHAKVVVLRLE